MHLCGIDLGTQSVKVIITGADLRVRGESRRSVSTAHPAPGWAEQDPLAWERALSEAVPEALAAAGIDGRKVAGIGVSGQLDGCITVDPAGQPTSPCLIWMDRRAELPALDHAQMLRVSGVVPDPGHMAAKIRWLRGQGIGGNARFHQPVSYLVERLTGRAVFDHGLASTTMLYDLDGRRYQPEFLRLFGVEQGALPEIAEATEVAGTLREAASWLGLPAGIPVAVGTGDDFATPLGAGICAPGVLTCVLGTAEVVGALATSAVRDPNGLVQTHAYPGKMYVVENPGWLSGGAQRWLEKLFELADFDAFCALAAAAPAGSHGVVCPPTLAGAMAPEWIASARGVFHGLSPGLGRAEMARALLEGCAFAMRDVIERLEALAVPCGQIMLLGGGARSELWAQIRADVARREVVVPARVDTCALGACVLAAVAIGAQPDLPSAVRLLPRDQKTFAPNSAQGQHYDAAYADYRRLFGCLEPLWRSKTILRT